MEALILRVSSRHGRGESFHRVDETLCTVGRAYHNSVIIGDPCIGALQFRIRREADAIGVEVLDDTNPVLVNGKPRVDRFFMLVPGDTLAVGHTEIALLGESMPVAPTRALHFSLWNRLGAWRPAVAIAMVLLTSAAAWFADYLGVTQKPDWGQLAMGPIMLALVVSAWSAMWAVVGRLLRNQPQFFTQLFVTAVATFATMESSLGAAYVAYASGFVKTLEALDWGTGAVISFALLLANLRIATNLRRPAWVAAGTVVAMLVLVHGLEYLGEEDFQPSPQAQTLLKPPFAKLRSGMSLDEFEQNAARLFERVREDADEQRRKQGGDSSSALQSLAAPPDSR